MDEFFPQSHFVVTSLLRGNWPWWNPYIFGGVPVLGNPQSLLFTPHTVIGLLSGSRFNLYWFDLTTLAGVLCGALALYRYGSAVGRAPVMALLGTLVFMLSGVATGRLQHVSQMVSYSLLPMVLLALRAVCMRPIVPRALLLLFVLLFEISNPNQVVFLAGFALAPFVILHLTEAPQPGRALALMAGATGAALLVALPQIAAIRELVGESSRVTLGLSDSAAGSLHGFHLASFSLPGVFEGRISADGTWGGDVTQNYLYIGVVPACAVLASILHSRACRQVLLCHAIIVFFLLFVLGTSGPLYTLPFEHVPGFANFRRPADGAFILNFVAALLIAISPAPSFTRSRVNWLRIALTAALGVAATLAVVSLAVYARKLGHQADFNDSLTSAGRRVIVAGGLVTLGLAARRRMPLLLPASMVLFTLADLTLAGRIGPLYCPRYSQYPEARLYLGREAAGPAAEPVEQPIAFLQQNGAGGAIPLYRMVALGGALGASMPLVFRIASMAGADPLVLGPYATALSGKNLETHVFTFSARAPNFGSELYRLAGLRYVLLHHYIIDHASDFGAYGEVTRQIREWLASSPAARLMPQPGTYEIWELTNAYPKAVLIGRNGTVDPDACSIETYRDAEITVRCQAPQSAVLEIGDNFARGWFACVNGREVPISPYQGLFRSIPVPAGESRIRMRFEPVPFWRAADCGSG